MSKKIELIDLNRIIETENIGDKLDLTLNLLLLKVNELVDILNSRKEEPDELEGEWTISDKALKAIKKLMKANRKLKPTKYKIPPEIAKFGKPLNSRKDKKV